MGSPDAAADFARVKALFDEVADLPADADCRARLDQLGVDPPLQARVMALVHQERSEITHLSVPITDTPSTAEAPELAAGDRLGPWLLVSPLGQGGMGQVYLAERADGLYEQDVAIKLLRGVSGPAELEQLARERRILATLSHPHIARLFDGGSTPRGRPYLVMERVQGLPIDAWCNRQQASLAQRLTLFDQVCQAVSHAHGRLVVHCDIKPGNVLVGADARAMLLDFGIALLQGRGGPDKVSLTPRYASPEQRAGEAATTASDIYGLGRLLDELLRAAPDADHRRDEWLAMVARATAEQPGQRYASVDALQRDLRRFHAHQPLEAMPRSVGYVWRKRARRRWPALLVAAGLAGLSLVFVLSVVAERDRAVQAEALARTEQRSAQQARAEALAQRDLATAAGTEATRQRDRATTASAEAAAQRDAARVAEAAARADRQRAEAARIEAVQQAATTAQVSEFLVDLFEGADPKRGGHPDIPALTLVDKGRDRLDAQLQDRPALQAEMKGVLARIYDNVGRPGDAAALYAQALAVERGPALRRPLREADLASRQAVVLANADRHLEAVAPARQALALRAARLPADAREMGDSHNTLGWVLTRAGRYTEARQQLERALQIRRRQPGPQQLELAATLHNLGLLEAGLDREPAAEGWLRESLDLKLRHLSPQHPTVLNTVQSLAVTLGQQQKFDQALPLLQQLVAGRVALTGPDSNHTAMAEHELAVVQRDSGRTEEALVTYRRSMQTKIRHNGERALTVAISLNNIAGALEQLGDPAAETHYRESLSIRRERLPAGDLAVARAEANLARWLLRQGRVAEARPLVHSSRQTRDARLAPGHGDRIDARLIDALLDLAEARPAAAETTLANELPATARTSQRLERLRLLARVRLAQGRVGDALDLRQQALALHLQAIGGQHPDGAWRRLELAQVLTLAGQPDPARAQLDAARPLLQRHHASSPAHVLAQTVQGQLDALARPDTRPGLGRLGDAVGPTAPQ